MRILIAFCLFLCLGCNTTSTPNSILEHKVSENITENDDGKLFLINKGDKVTLSLAVSNNEDYFWNVSEMNGEFEVLSDTLKGNKQVMVIQCNTSGKIGFDYVNFTNKGARIISTLNVNFKVK